MSLFTIEKLSSKDIPSRAEYYEIGEDLPHISSGSEDYYLKADSDTLLTAFAGSGASELNLGPTPKTGDYKALMSGINPRTGKSFCSKTRRTQLDKEINALAGFSTSFNVEKSLSLLYATLTSNQQIKFEQAMIEATSRTIQHLEERGIFAYRTGAQGSESHPGEVVAATYLHFTNRNQEPHLHVHAEIPNLILGSDGQWRTLDARELYRRQVEIGALFDASLASILQRDLPEIASHLECNPERSGLVVAGIDRDTVMRFSTRREEIQDALKAMGASGADAARAVAKRTRQAKAAVDGKLLREEWKSRLADLSPAPGDLTPATLLDVEAMVFKNRSVFKQHDLDRAVAMLSILRGGISFTLNGKREREVIRDMPVNDKTIAYAKSIRELVVDEIKRGVFDYQRRFPDSGKVTQAGVVVGQVQSPLPAQPAIAVPVEVPSAPPTGTMTVKEGVMLWLRVAKSGTASTTYLNYKCKAGHVVRHFGDTPIDKVTIQDLRLFRNYLVKPENGKKGLSPKTVNDVLTIVRGVWADAKSNTLIPSNHMESIHNHKVKYKSLADPFTRDEIKRIQHADPQRLREARMVVMNCWSGLSRSELMALAREDVDLDNRLIHVRRAYVDGIYRIPKEEKRERFVELIKPAAELMKLILEDTTSCKPQQIDVTQRDNLTTEAECVTFLFRDWTTGNAWHPDHLDAWFKEHLVKSKVNHRGINQCRHTFASQALSSHVTLEWLAKQLGHADTTMIKKHYAKLIPADTKRMGQHVSEQMGFGEDWSGV